MTSIYQKVLGDQFGKLHPMLQKRYSLTKEKGFIGKGEMIEISGGNFFIRKMFHLGVPYRVFFPERGRNIPFTIENKVREDGIVEWNRTFLFKNQPRYFDAIMFLDEKETTIIDLFGKPAILGSTLAFDVDETTGAMEIRSLKQWLILKGKRLPLPRFLHGEARIIESFDEASQLFKVQVEVKNALLGTLFLYRGSFKEVDAP
jgi:hypothetical protein